MDQVQFTSNLKKPSPIIMTHVLPMNDSRRKKNADTFRFVNLPFNLNVSFSAFLPLFPSFNRLFFFCSKDTHTHLDYRLINASR